MRINPNLRLMEPDISKLSMLHIYVFQTFYSTTFIIGLC